MFYFYTKKCCILILQKYKKKTIRQYQEPNNKTISLWKYFYHFNFQVTCYKILAKYVFSLLLLGSLEVNQLYWPVEIYSVLLKPTSGAQQHILLYINVPNNHDINLSK